MQTTSNSGRFRCTDPFCGSRASQKFLHNTGMHHLYIGLVYNAPQRSTFEVHSKSVPTRACRHVQGCVLHTSSNFEQQLLRNPDVQGQLDLASNVLSRTAIADARLQAHRHYFTLTSSKERPYTVARFHAAVGQLNVGKLTP